MTDPTKVETVELDLEGIRELQTQFIEGLEELGVEDPESHVHVSAEAGEMGFHAPAEQSDDPQVWSTIGALYVIDIVLALAEDEGEE